MVRPLSIWGEKPLKNALSNLLKPALNDRDKLLVTLINEWNLIVGEEIARITAPQEIRNMKSESVLTLGVTPGMNTMIAHQEPELLEKIGQFIGQGRITRIKLTGIPPRA